MENQGEKVRRDPLPAQPYLSALSISFKISKFLYLYSFHQFYLVMPTKIECNEPITSNLYRMS